MIIAETTGLNKGIKLLIDDGLLISDIGDWRVAHSASTNIAVNVFSVGKKFALLLNEPEYANRSEFASTMLTVYNR